MPKATVKNVDTAIKIIPVTPYSTTTASIPTRNNPSSITSETNETLSALWDVAIPALREIGQWSGDLLSKEKAREALREMGAG